MAIRLTDLRPDERNRAHDLIEDFMIAANGVAVRYLDRKGFPSLRRVLRSPERWERIVDLAASLGEQLPSKPDAVALERFLAKRSEADPVRFPDLSLSVIKLLGRGEYVLELSGRPVDGHFGLAVKDYTHSTAPNRRFPDLITHRLLKAALAGRPAPYSNGELSQLAQHCTEEEDAATKVERQVRKSAAALLLESRIGDQFDAIVTGASNKGTWVRIDQPAAEGKVVRGDKGLDVGDRVRVELVDTNVERGYVDFAKVHKHMKPPKAAKRPLAYRDQQFLDSDEARPLRILAEYLEPLEIFCRERVHDTIVFFGSARIAPDGLLGRYYEEARELARLITAWSKGLAPNAHRYIICSGGGGGIMEAANRGASEAGGRTIGLNIGLPHEQRPNQYITRELSIEFHYFFMRKLWFAHLARALVVFPGGFGTLDEMFEILTLEQTRKLDRSIPVVLYGSSYWKEIINFEALVRHGTISREDLGLFQFADDPATALRMLQQRLSTAPEEDTPAFAHSRTCR